MSIRKDVPWHLRHMWNVDGIYRYYQLKKVMLINAYIEIATRQNMPIGDIVNGVDSMHASHKAD